MLVARHREAAEKLAAEQLKSKPAPAQEVEPVPAATEVKVAKPSKPTEVTASSEPTE